MQDSALSNQGSSPMKGPDKDRRYRLMNELLKTNQKHIEHLKQMTDQLKKTKQLQYEQQQKEDLQRENAALKKQVLQYKERLRLGGFDEGDRSANNSQVWRREEIHSESQSQQNVKIDDLLLGQEMVTSPQFVTESVPERPLSHSSEKYDERNTPQRPTVPELKINVKHILQSSSNGNSVAGPLTSVKKSQTYMCELRDERLAQQMKRSIIILPDTEKNGRGSSGQTSEMAKSHSQQFSFQSPIGEFLKGSINPVPVTEEDLDAADPQIKQASSIVELPQVGLPRIFEDFYIIGCQKRDFLEFDADPELNEGIVRAQILYKYQPTSENSYEYILTQFAYPFGIKAERLKGNDWFPRLKEIMYSGNKYELLDKFHIFTLKNQDDQATYVSEVLESTNPEHRLYGISLSVFDYIESTDEMNRSKRTFWKYRKTYCFLTYFPFVEFFQDTLVQLISK